jgi:Trk K+ transport system NAD-binding subunit/nucleotide-binding universal stress UspA family protein
LRTHRHVVLIGLGRVGQALLAELSENWTVSAVDTSAEALATLPATCGGQTVDRIQGDATSRLVLSRAGLSSRTMVAILTGSDETNLEIARVIRAHFQVDNLVCLLHNDSRSSANGLLGNEVILRSVAAARHAMSGLSRSAPHLLEEQLARGELQVVQVLPGSAAVGRTLSQLKPQRWLIAAIYRDNALVVPHGETVLEAGDRVMLTGEPDVVESVANFIHGAEAVFPTQYGSSIGFHGDEMVMREATWLQEKTHAERLLPITQEQLDTRHLTAADIALNLSRQEVGLLVLESRPLRLSSRLGLNTSSRKQLILSARTPVLVARSGRPYRRILMAVSSMQSVHAISVIAMDIATLVGASLTVLTVLPPSLSKGEEALRPLRTLPRQVADLGQLRGLEVDTIISEGNPIRQIRTHAADFDLLVVGHSHQQRNTVFTPDISLYLLHSTPCSVLFVPWNAAGR